MKNYIIVLSLFSSVLHAAQRGGRVDMATVVAPKVDYDVVQQNELLKSTGKASFWKEVDQNPTKIQLAPRVDGNKAAYRIGIAAMKMPFFNIGLGRFVRSNNNDDRVSILGNRNFFIGSDRAKYTTIGLGVAAAAAWWYRLRK